MPLLNRNGSQARSVPKESSNVHFSNTRELTRYPFAAVVFDEGFQKEISYTYKLFIQLDMLACIVMRRAPGKRGRPVAVVGKVRSILRVRALLFRGRGSKRESVKGICELGPHNLLTCL